MKNYYEYLVKCTKNYVEDSGLNGALVGLSGGIDSALTLKIAQDALGSDGVQAVLMPSKYTSKDSVSFAIELANNLNIKYHVLGIDDILSLLSSIPLLQPNEGDIVEQNMQSRIRALILMTMSNKYNNMVLATGNRSEILTGYSTLYGDTCGGYAPLKYVYKTDIYKIASWINANYADVIPNFIIERAPTAELRFEQTDSQSLPEYQILDDILKKIVDLNLSVEEVSASIYDVFLVKKVQSLVQKSRYKRLQYPQGPNLYNYQDALGLTGHTSNHHKFNF